METARYHGLRDDLVDAIDEEFAETVRVVPFAGGRHDPDREEATIVAVLRTREEKALTMGPGGGDDWKSRTSASETVLRINRGLAPLPAFRKGDRVRAMARPGQPWFEVLHVDDRSHVRLILELGEI